MAFLRITAAWAAVLGLLALWHVVERTRRGAGPDRARLQAALPALATESALLTLFGGLWFASLGSGGAALLFFLVGCLMEIPVRLRAGGLVALPWRAVAGGVLRTVLAGEVLALVMG